MASSGSTADPLHVVSEANVTRGDMHRCIMGNDALLRHWSDAGNAAKEVREAVD